MYTSYTNLHSIHFLLDLLPILKRSILHIKRVCKDPTLYPNYNALP